MNVITSLAITNLGNPNDPQVVTMLQESDAYHASLYPNESNHLLDVTALTQDNVYFFTANVQDSIRGFGALVVFKDYAEIKRMFVSPQFRGMGIGQQLLKALENQASNLEIKIIRLETGTRQPEALSLYTATGYAMIAPFGDYVLDPLSIFMEKRLSNKGSFT